MILSVSDEAAHSRKWLYLRVRDSTSSSSHPVPVVTSIVSPLTRRLQDSQAAKSCVGKGGVEGVQPNIRHSLPEGPTVTATYTQTSGQQFVDYCTGAAKSQTRELFLSKGMTRDISWSPTSSRQSQSCSEMVGNMYPPKVRLKSLHLP